ncbi:hypothetical protein HanPI659440_Chr08g0294481 [Helianthus annuus]|nr:hypothetical protein HanPI659440_Chr08g0294481 [Helianthus annuus]
MAREINRRQSTCSDFIDNIRFTRGKRVASDAGFVAKELLKCTGKAAWIAETIF